MEKKTEDIEPKIPRTRQAVFRIGLTLITVIALFAFARQMAIPATFGEYGRYRGDSIAENVNHEVNFASSGAICAGCHKDAFQVVSSANHGKMDCQTCHGPAAKHTENPGSGQPRIEKATALCLSCHSETQGRAGQLATIKPQSHNTGLDCTQCHVPHSPWAKIRG